MTSHNTLPFMFWEVISFDKYSETFLLTFNKVWLDQCDVQRAIPSTSSHSYSYFSVFSLKDYEWKAPWKEKPHNNSIKCETRNYFALLSPQGHGGDWLFAAGDSRHLLLRVLSPWRPAATRRETQARWWSWAAAVGILSHKSVSVYMKKIAIQRQWKNVALWWQSRSLFFFWQSCEAKRKLKPHATGSKRNTAPTLSSKASGLVSGTLGPKKSSS